MGSDVTQTRVWIPALLFLGPLGESRQLSVPCFHLCKAGIVLHVRPPRGGLVPEANGITSGFSGLELGCRLLARAEWQLTCLHGALA